MQIAPISVPDDVRNWIRNVFAECNEAVAVKMTRVPTVHETSLDLTLIERLSAFSSPVRFESEWLVRIDAHYLGGGRHFGQWEIADIGLLVVFRRNGVIVRTKVGLLQSKRLYPDEQEFSEDEAVDYMIGFARLMHPQSQEFLSVTSPRTFTFSGSSRYKAFHVGLMQFEIIQKYEARHGIPIHYLFYHPMRVPSRQVIPLSAVSEPKLVCEVGCRIISAKAVNESVGKFDNGYSPTYDDLRAIPSEATAGGKWPGWRLEQFVVDRLMACHEGHTAVSESDEGLRQIFNRRSGPIAAAVAITFDLPAQGG
ncbi:MAG: hypothetical protein JO231_21290 [Acidobacteria bacterium]|nr:hypothetical protein [Acidobacteriota bacterium]